MLKEDPAPPFDLLLKDHDPAGGVNACRMLAKLKNTAWANLPVVGAPAVGYACRAKPQSTLSQGHSGDEQLGWSRTLSL